MTKFYQKFLFILILFLAIFLRFYRLGSLMPSLNWDEISHGYNAYSLLKTGKDQWNQPFPVFNFRAYGDYPMAANLYLTLPFIKVFGLNNYSVRLPSAVLGSIFVVIIYLFVYKVTRNQLLSLVIMTASAIIPWTLFPSRAVFQSNLAQLFLLLSLLLLIISRSKIRFFPFSILFLVVSSYCYHNTRFLSPFLIVAYFTHYCYYHHHLQNFKKILLTSSLILLLYLPNFFNIFQPESWARTQWVGVLGQNSINIINEKRRLFNGPQFVSRIVYNKASFLGNVLVKNYLSFFNPSYIFFRGSQNYQFNPPQTPLIFSVFLPFFYIGIYPLLKKYPFLFFMWMLTLLPAALTIGDYPSIRMTIAVPFYLLSIALGISATIKVLKSSYPAYLFIVIVSLIQLNFWWQRYSTDYATNYSQAWQYGYQPAVDYIRAVYKKYDHVVFTKKYGEPHQFILFYWPWEPAIYQSSPVLWDFHSGWYWVNSFDKFTFIDDWQIKDQTFYPKTLLITSPDNVPNINLTKLKTIYYPNSKPVFEIYEN